MRRATSLAVLLASLGAPGTSVATVLDVNIHEWDLPTSGSLPHDPAVAPDGSLWYTAQKANRLGRLDPATGQIAEYKLPTPDSGPHGLAADRNGRTPTLFRPPYGEYDARVLRLAAELGLTTVEYDLPSGDPDVHATKQSLVEWVLREARPGSIIVMHINHRRFPTAEALPEIVAGLRRRGFELVTVGELLHSPQVPGEAVAHVHHVGHIHA